MIRVRTTDRLGSDQNISRSRHFPRTIFCERHFLQSDRRLRPYNLKKRGWDGEVATISSDVRRFDRMGQG